MNWHLFPANVFPSHRQAWDKLNQQGPKTPVLDSRFVEALLKHFGTGKELLAIAGAPDNPSAMAVIHNSKFGVWSTFRPAQSIMGLWLVQSGGTFQGLLPSLASSLPSGVLLIGINDQDPQYNPRPEEDCHISTLHHIETAYVDIDGSFDTYWAARGKNLRHNLKRQRNRLERDGTVTRLELFTSPQDMSQAVRQYAEMESAGWKNQAHSAVQIDNAQGGFYLDIMSAFADTGQAIAYRYYYDDKLVASDLCVQGDECLIILKTTYDESIQGSSPALLMRQESFELIFNEHKFRRIEFYGRLMEWHLKWSNTTRTLYHVNYFHWKLLFFIKKLFFHKSNKNKGFNES